MLEDGWGWGLRGAGGVLTCTHDLARFHEAITTPGVLLSVRSLDVMDAIVWREGQPMALGWFADAASDGTLRRRHGGGTRGFMAELRRYPDRDAMIAVMTNMRWRPDALADRLEAVLLDIRSPKVRAEMDLEGLTLTQWKAVSIEAPRLRVEPNDDDGVRVVAQTTTNDALVLELNASAARHVRTTLESILERDATNSLERTSLGLYTAPYELRGTRLAIDGEGVELHVMPGYNRQPGPTLVVMDTSRQFWPVIWRLSDDDARALTEALASRVEAGKQDPQPGGQP